VGSSQPCDTMVVTMSRPYAKYLTHIWKSDDPTIRDVRVHYYNLTMDDPTRLFLESVLRSLSNNGVTNNTGMAQYVCKIPTVLIPLLKTKCIEKRLEIKWIHFDRD
jgi:hypothetical protein